MKLLKDIIIAIDGYSSCGKSTLSRNLAKCLGYRHIDTGAMYRAITYYSLQNNIIISKNQIDKKRLLSELPYLEIEFKFNNQNLVNEIYLNGKLIEPSIRETIVSEYTSIVSTIPEVRENMIRLQRKMGKEKRIVMDGRDIGTVVFPDADIKFFMTANLDIRAQRRFKELSENGVITSIENVKKNIEERDYLDTHRYINPLKKAEDAIVIDNSFMTKEAQLGYVIDILKKRFPYES